MRGSGARARELSQPRQRELHLNSALAADQLMPFIDHYEFQIGEQRLTFRPCQQQRNAFRRRHQRLRQTQRLARAFAGIGVAGANADAPIETQFGERRSECPRRIGSKRAHRREPQHAQAALRLGAGCIRRKLAS